MGPLTAGQIFQVCLDAGFTPDQAVTWTAIALAESGGDPAAHNPRGEDSWGLWQINVDPAVRPNHWGDLTDPAVNARAAYEVSNGGTDLRPWTVTHDANAGTAKDYRNFMDEAQAAAGGGDLGDFSGVSGYDDAAPGGSGPDPGPVEAPGPAATATGGPDSDGDGAVDAFEMSAGTDPHVPDSDADGLSDGFELDNGLDALAIDADADGLSDRHELRVGSDARSADTDADGVADAYELAAGRDAAHGLAAGAAPHDPVDADADGMSDAWEAAVGTDPTSGDSDDDGVVDVVELVHRADALDPDSDGDGQLDGVDLLADLGADRSGAAEATWTGIDPDALPTIAAVQAEVAQLTGLTEQLAGLAPAPAATPAPAAGGATQQFLDAALAQTGDEYVFGGEAAPDDADPGAFDCSELTQWAAGQVGVELPDGSWHQYLELEQRGALVPVEQALHTPGALLFSFSSEPTAGGGRPAEAHVAISLGNGDTIEARSTRYGVGSWDAGDRFTYAAVIPELAGVPIPVEAADDGTGADPDIAGIAAVGDVQALRAGPAGVAPLAEQIHLTARPQVAPVEPGAPAADGPGFAPDPATAGAGLSPVAVVARPAPVPGDGDADGVVDAFEMSAGTDPLVADSDGDGLSDGFELGTGLDGLQLDADGDGLSDAWEVRLGTRTDTVDSDGDGRADGLEVALGRDARFGLANPGPGPAGDGVTVGLVDPAVDPAVDPVVDTDGDGLSDAWEAMLGADPTASDTDHDGLGDALELAGHTDPDDPDTDDDGVTDRWDGLDDPKA